MVFLVIGHDSPHLRKHIPEVADVVQVQGG